MVNKINKYSRGRTGVLEYLLNFDRVENGTAVVIKGNVELTASLIKNSKHVHKYLSGGLYFGSDVPTKKQEMEIIKDFEKMLFAGLDKTQFNILWVKHTDKGVTELNYVVPKVELTTGKSLDVFYGRRDLPIFDMWKNGINTKYGFKCNPNDEERQRTPEQRAEAIVRSRSNWVGGQSIVKNRGLIDTKLKEKVNKGEINNREEMIDFLVDNGFDITRKNAKSFSIKHASIGKKALRLKDNFIYTEQFNKPMMAYRIKEKTDWLKPEFEPSTYEKYLNRRAKRHISKYAMADAPKPKPKKEAPHDTIRNENKRARNETAAGSRNTYRSRESGGGGERNLGKLFEKNELKYDFDFERIAEAITARKKAERSRNTIAEIVYEVGKREEKIGSTFGRKIGRIIEILKDAFLDKTEKLEEEESDFKFIYAETLNEIEEEYLIRGSESEEESPEDDNTKLLREIREENARQRELNKAEAKEVNVENVDLNL